MSSRGQVSIMGLIAEVDREEEWRMAENAAASLPMCKVLQKQAIVCYLIGDAAASLCKCAKLEAANCLLLSRTMRLLVGLRATRKALCIALSVYRTLINCKGST